MKISSLYIDGFGKFRDWKPPAPFGEGLTAIHGPNEAGKTTLLAFIRRMLYGFPDGRRKDLNHYSPINGGTIGGRLEIRGEDGQEYVLSRSGVRGDPLLTRPDGTAVRGMSPSSLLGPCDQVFYENVCAIGLGELQEVSTLSRDEIRERLAAAGAGNLPVRAVADALESSAAEIYTLKGKKKRINTLVKDLKAVETEVRSIQKSQQDYDPINDAILQKREAVSEEEKRRKRIEDEIAYCTALGQAWEAFAERKEGCDRLRSIPEIEPFPDGALEDLGRIETDLQRLGEERDDQKADCERLKGDIGSVVLRDEVLERADAIRALERTVERYHTQEKEHTSTAAELEQKQDDLDRALRDLGEGWNAESVLGFDTSVPVREEAKALRERLAGSATACAAAQSRHEAAEAEAREKRENREGLQRQRDAIPPSALRDAVLDQADRIRTIERTVERYLVQGKDLGGLQSELRQKQGELDRMLRDLGGDWDVERVTGFDASVPAREDHKNLRDRLSVSAQARDLEGSRCEAAEKDVAEKREHLGDLQKQRNAFGEVPDPATARTRLGWCREMVDGVQQLQDLEGRRQSILQEQARAREIVASLGAAPALPAWPAVLVVLSAVVVVGWGYLGGALQAAGVVAVLLLVAAAALFRARDGRAPAPGAEGAAEQYAGERETLAGQRRHVEEERENLEERIRSRAAMLGVGPLPSRGEAGEVLHACEDAVTAADRASDLDRDIAHAAEVSERAGKTLETRRQALEEAHTEYLAALDAWKGWCRQRALPETMNPDLVPDLIALIRQAAALAAGIQEMREREAIQAAEVRGFEEEVQGVVAICREVADGSTEAPGAIAGVESDRGGDATRRAAETLIRLMEDASAQAAKVSALDRDIVRAAEASERAEVSREAAQAALTQARTERLAALDAWKDWCRQRALPETTDPDLVPDLIAGIGQAATLCAGIEEVKRKMAGQSGDIRSFAEEVVSVADACNEPSDGPPDTVLEGLIRVLNVEEEARREYAALARQLKEKGEKLERTSVRYDAKKADLEALLRGQGAETLEEFRRLEALSRQRAEVARGIKDAESAIRRISGEERYPAFMAALETYDPVGMPVYRQEKEAELAAVRDRISHYHHEIGILTERCSGIESDGELTLLLSRAAALEEEIRQVSRQWAVYTAASGLLGMAVETFERERQPEILREAQAFFSRITDGRYTRVVRPLDGSEMYVEERSGGRKGIDELSRGTAEQLYLALRFGYIRDYATSSLAVPVIFDDILVNFDPVRRQNACLAIADLAETCQVLYFTCHPETLESLTAAVPDAVVVDLCGGV
ncbi:AAA family ATPase [Methanofollis tationis]|uniref:AAA family ATPase n=1 Tax=Methanofollis tationis TaxID=81417 RepID=A0A7K4HMF3_9EURY|nr:AAA family ATPase [Methanofollis tationis]NVO66441.1 AAA family ATPase [Methanofollis tationis]